IFYTLAIGMLLGSLLGIQIGALVTKVVSDTTIRGFYAIAILAGFVNRLFALPSKLIQMEILPWSIQTGDFLNSIGIWLFFVVVGIFGLWVFSIFFKNLSVLKNEEVK
ncbi:MAG: sulfite exporter TauE/SafE family protein, partial [Desulfobacteraceae bacterium]|nr:sulfite exporter TauE/SafE family protein [Desulfobacteraceae bacterium]